MCQLGFLLYFRAFLRLHIQQWAQALQLALPQGQQWPQRIAGYQFGFIDEGHQQMNTADRLFPRQRGTQPGFLQQGLGGLRQLRAATHRARAIIQPGQQLLPQGVQLPLVTAGQYRDIPFPLFQEFQQPVLRQDFRMGAGLAQ
ncbi:hypothetical protein SRDD_00820 [Serratia sp. DD3]|nr:hypothetical protein SRDD_00820 [Serratia sp. DD3]